MDKRNYIELLDRFFKGLTNETEEKALREWIVLPGSKEVCFDHYQREWEQASNTMNADIQARMFSEIVEKVDALEKQGPVKRKYKLTSWLRYAAAVCVVCMVGLGTYYFTRSNMLSGEEFIVFAERGQKANIELPDGTVVWLNSDTKLSYKNSYNSKDRTLVLSGEAFFDVAKNKEKPFVVIANDVDIEALGTQFNVKAYKDENQITTTLVEGAVRLKDDKQSIVLNPNEQVIYARNTSRFSSKVKIDSERTVPWRNNELTFNGENLGEIALTLERIYNLHIDFADEKLKKYTFSGHIRNNSLSNVLDLLTYAVPIAYVSNGDTIKIIRK